MQKFFRQIVLSPSTTVIFHTVSKVISFLYIRTSRTSKWHKPSTRVSTPNSLQIKEALSQLYAYKGFPRSLNSLGTLQKVIAQRTDINQGAESSPMPSDYNALTQGTEIQTKLTGQPFNYEFCPAEDYYLKAHLFGDIFARDVLTHADRELVTVSALSGLQGVMEWGKEAVELKPGVTIAVPEGVKHWHGAAADSWMQHLTYHADAKPGNSNEWLEPVSNEVYGKLK